LQSSSGLRSKDNDIMHEAMICRPSDSSLQRFNRGLLTVLAVKVTAVLPKHDSQE